MSIHRKKESIFTFKLKVLLKYVFVRNSKLKARIFDSGFLEISFEFGSNCIQIKLKLG